MAGMNGEQLGIDMADALGVTDSDAIDKWKSIGETIITHIIDNIQINLNSIFAQGVPVPNDGGAALQAFWKILGDQGGLAK